MSKIAVMGFGVVGSGTVEVIYNSKQSIERKTGKTIEVKHILDLRDFPDSPYADKLTKDFNDILNDSEVDIVVEAMGGLNPAYDFCKACLLAGKSVVTSNKELVAAKGAELLQIASQNNVNFFFEASVGGGVPIIRPLHMCLAANEINEIAGILNGTTNFILTKMIREKMTFDDALSLAQELGYAESDPSADVDGHDSCRKICILASLAFGRHVYPENIYTEGITKITAEDVEYAGSWGGAVKLIGWAKAVNKNGAKESDVIAMVCPAFVSSDSQLASVDDVFNGILVRGDATGDVVFYGKGAGKYPTASSMVADVIDVAKANGTSQTLTWEDSDQDFLLDYKEAELAKYVRAECESREDCEKLIEREFGQVTLLSRKNCPKNEIAFVTPIMTEGKIDDNIAKLEDSGMKILSTIRVLDY